MNLLKEQTLITLKNYSHVDDINEAYYVDEIGIHWQNQSHKCYLNNPNSDHFH